jgi:hypothetical protein
MAAVFIHSVSVPKSTRIIGQYLETIEASGLKSHAPTIYIGVVGKNAREYGVSVQEQFPEWDIQIIATNEDIKAFEFPTLDAMQHWCMRNPYQKVLYIHVKGACEEGVLAVSKANWGRAMMHFLVTRWKDCFALLEKYNAVGYDLVYGAIEGKPVALNGNFWWAKSEYIARLYELRKIDWGPGTRHLCEFWVCSGDYYQVCSVHQSTVTHNNERYPAEKYEGVPTAEWVIPDEERKVVNIAAGSVFDIRGAGGQREIEPDRNRCPEDKGPGA